MTGRSFYNRVNDYRQYRNATHNMHNQYPDATAENLATDNTCIVCREDMKPWIGTLPATEQAVNRNTGNYSISERQRPKKLPCGHILHFSCLRSWLERQQACPICRRSVLRPLQVPGDATQPPANGAPQQPGHNGAGAAGVRPPNPPNRGGQRPVGWGFRLGPFRFFFGRLDGDQGLNRIAQRANGGRQRNVRNPQPPVVPQMRHHGVDPAAFVPPQPEGTGQTPTATSELNANTESVGNQNAVDDPAERFTRSLQAHSLHAHLTAIERMIQEDVRSLNLAEHRIQTIHWLLAELERARAEAAAQQGAIVPIQLPSRMPEHEGVSTPESSNAASQVVLDHQGNMLATLPQGWTVIPFHPVPQGANGQASTGEHTTQVEGSSATNNTGANDMPHQNGALNGMPGINILQPTPTQPLPFSFANPVPQGVGTEIEQTPISQQPGSSQSSGTISPETGFSGLQNFQTTPLRNAATVPGAPSIADLARVASSAMNGTINTAHSAGETPVGISDLLSSANGTSWSFGNLQQATEAQPNGTNGTSSRSPVEPEGSSSAISRSNSNEEARKRASHQPSVEDLEDEAAD
jgi:E3 ubiquitin-protein ligase synoviolin